MIPYILTALGGYLVGSSVKQYASGGQIKLLAPNGKPSNLTPEQYKLVVVMWFYEKHEIWISVDTDINGRFRYSLRKYNITNGAWEVKNPTSISEYFNSPTEAYEAAIEYTLNNLI